MPLLDLLTSLQVDSMEPVGTGVLYQQGDSLQDAGQAMDKEIGVILASKVQLALLLPVERSRDSGGGHFDRAPARAWRGPAMLSCFPACSVKVCAGD